jgi:Winged helix DNA-binding domain
LGVSRRAELRSWFASLGDELATVDVDGAECVMMADDGDALARTRPSREVRLLAGFDQYVLGAGTGDTRIVPAERRKAVSRTAGWISPVVVHQGRVVGVWELTEATADVRLFAEADGPAGAA